MKVMVVQVVDQAITHGGCPFFCGLKKYKFKAIAYANSMTTNQLRGKEMAHSKNFAYGNLFEKASLGENGIPFGGVWNQVLVTRIKFRDIMIMQKFYSKASL